MELKQRILCNKPLKSMLITMNDDDPPIIYENVTCQEQRIEQQEELNDSMIHRISELEFKSYEYQQLFDNEIRQQSITDQYDDDEVTKHVRDDLVD